MNAIKRAQVQAIHARLSRLYKRVQDAERIRKKAHRKLTGHRDLPPLAKKLTSPFIYGAKRLNADTRTRIMALRKRITEEELALREFLRAPAEDWDEDFLYVRACEAIRDARALFCRKRIFLEAKEKTSSKILHALFNRQIVSMDQEIDTAIANVHDAVWVYSKIAKKNIRLASCSRYENMMLLYQTSEYQDPTSLLRDLFIVDKEFDRLEKNLMKESFR